MFFIDWWKDIPGERELKMVLWSQEIPNRSRLSDLYESSNHLREFHKKVCSLLNENERKEVFDIVVHVARQSRVLLPAIQSGDIDAFMTWVHAIYSEVRAKELSFQKFPDGEIVRSFEFSKKWPLNFYKNPDGLTSVGGYR